jgi:hypothetical protein
MSSSMNNPSAVFNVNGTVGAAKFLNRSGIRIAAYWLFTLLVVFENAAGFVWAFLHIGYLRVMLTHLGFPQYFMNIIGPWQLACAAALIAPGIPLIKEWAYAGAFFNYSSAIVSHVSVGDGPDKWAAAAVFAVFSVCSWTLRPPDRRLAGSRSIREIGVCRGVCPSSFSFS